jgi:hypothetical protein
MGIEPWLGRARIAALDQFRRRRCAAAYTSELASRMIQADRRIQERSVQAVGDLKPRVFRVRAAAREVEGHPENGRISAWSCPSELFVADAWPPERPCDIGVIRTKRAVLGAPGVQHAPELAYNPGRRMLDDGRRNVRKVDRRVSSRLPAVEAAAWTEAFAADDRSRPTAAALRPPAGGRSAEARRGAPGSRSVRSPSHWLAAR